MSTSPNPTSGSATLAPRGASSPEERGRERTADSVAAASRGNVEAATVRHEWTGAQVAEKLYAAKDRVAMRVQDGRVKVAQHVQEHPMRTVLYAFGAGALLGLLLRRRNRGD